MEKNYIVKFKNTVRALIIFFNIYLFIYYKNNTFLTF